MSKIINRLVNWLVDDRTSKNVFSDDLPNTSQFLNVDSNQKTGFSSIKSTECMVKRKKIDSISPINKTFDFMPLQELSEFLQKRENSIIRDKDMWENTFESIPDILIIVDRDRNIVRANKKFFEVTKLDKDSVVGKKCYDIMFGSSHKCSFTEKGSCFSEHCEKSECVTINNGLLSGIYLFSVAKIQSVDTDFVDHDSIIMLRDITKLKQIENNLINKEKMIDCLSKIGGYLMQDMRWKDVIGLVLEHTVSILNFDFGFIMSRKEENLFDVVDYYDVYNRININSVNKYMSSEPVISHLSKPHEQMIMLNCENNSLFKGMCILPIKINNICGYPYDYYLVLCSSSLVEKIDELYIRTARTVANLLGSFLAKITIQETLKEKEIFYTTLINNHILEYAFRINVNDCTFTYCSKAFADMLKIKSPNDILNNNIQSVFQENQNYLKDLRGILNKLSMTNQVLHGVFTLINGGKEEKHEQIIRGIFKDSVLTEIQCVGKKL